MARSRVWLSAVVAAGFLGGCSDPVTNTPGPGVDSGTNPGTDAGMTGMDGGMNTGDGGMMKGGDGGMRDAGRDGATDARPVDRPPPRDAGPAVTNPCASDAQIDLTTRMPNAMGVVSYQGDNNRAPEMGGVATPAGCLLMAGMNMPFLGYQVAHRYRMRATAVLEATTVSDNTTETLDTGILILTSCGGAAMNLGCNDDVSQMVVQSRARSGEPIAAGTEVFVIVGSYNPPVGGADVQGDYELLLREITPIPVGMTCRAGDVCAANSACIAATSGATMGTCVADGTQGGRCRLGGTDAGVGTGACDMGLSCSVAMPTTSTRGTCLRMIMPGNECGAVGTACMAGSTCQPAPVAMNLDRRECVVDGAQGGNCRSGDPRCDGMLQCSSNNACRAAAMAGAACDLSGRRDFCPSGSACAPNAMLNGGTCVAAGTVAGSPCRAVDAGSRCDMGLTCSSATGTGVCRREVANGMPCDRRFNSTICAMDGTCEGTGTEVTGTCRAPTAEMEANNAPAMGNGPVTMSTVFRAALPEGDTDCFRVTVPMGGSIRAQTSDANGGCSLGMGADTVITLHDPAGMEIATNDDAGGTLCSLIDPNATAAARNLAAGTYAVCVESYMGTPAIASYFVRITVSGP